MGICGVVPIEVHQIVLLEGEIGLPEALEEVVVDEPL